MLICKLHCHPCFQTLKNNHTIYHKANQPRSQIPLR
jgi:hypothetical protein